MIKIKQCLISVSDKTGILDLGRALAKHDINIISTGGTAEHLAKGGLDITPIQKVTGFPEIMDGRVKTLHPAVFGGILAVRDKAEHMAAIAEHNISPIDLVVVNLYPFEKTVTQKNTTFEDVIENIDIGGPSLVRATAKNHAHAVIVVNPEDYGKLISLLDQHNGIPEEWSKQMAVKAFGHTAKYDATIHRYLGEGEKPARRTLKMIKASDLRYGENPHQSAVFYRDLDALKGTAASADVLAGEGRLSFNNIMDLDAAFRLVKEFTQPAAAIIKHTNPCGAGIGADLREAFDKADQGDPRSAFGGIVAVNRTMDAATAKIMLSKGHFFEAVIAPDYEEGVVEMLKKRAGWGEKLRILKTGPIGKNICMKDYKRVEGGFLEQDMDVPVEKTDYEIATNQQPTDAEQADLAFAWRVCKHVKSNAIVIVRDGCLVGTGAGQTSRVDSTQIAIQKAHERTQGAVLASDAFFPFPDSVEIAGTAGITAIIQPGGSVKDKEVVAEADKQNMAMLLTGKRHFKH